MARKSRSGAGHHMPFGLHHDMIMEVMTSHQNTPCRTPGWPVPRSNVAVLWVFLLLSALGLADNSSYAGKAVAGVAPGAVGQSGGQVYFQDGDEAEQARVLQSSVDTVALTLGGIFRTMPTSAARHTALTTALNALTFEQGGDVYFTAWHGTRIIHSPLTPDLENMDFSEAKDENGRPFVQEMERIVREGGGFVAVTLPRQRLACPVQTLRLPEFSLGQDSVFLRLYGSRLYASNANRQRLSFNDGQGEGHTAISASSMEAASRDGFLSGTERPAAETPEIKESDGKPQVGAVAFSGPVGALSESGFTAALPRIPGYDTAGKLSRAGADAREESPEELPEELPDKPGPALSKSRYGLPTGSWAPWMWKEGSSTFRQLPEPPAMPPPPAVLEARPVRQILYVRPIPGSDWHIAAFMPVGPPLVEEGESPHLAGKAASEAGSSFGAGTAVESTMLTGLAVCGLALTGLIALLGFTIFKRKRENS